jgi:hypothetical protein
MYISDTDPELERWRSRSAEPRIMTNTEIGPTSIQGWLEIQKVTPFDSGNYTCVPSYAIPAWIQILVLPGMYYCNFTIFFLKTVCMYLLIYLFNNIREFLYLYIIIQV